MNIASIDIGTNTVLMLIANINKDDKTIKALLNEYKMPRIGKGLVTGGEIGEDQIESLFNVLNDYSNLIKDYHCEAVLVKGTSALRRASNSNEIIRAIKERFGFDVDIISGNEEARLSYIGSVSTVYTSGLVKDTPESFVVIDIGGGSTEIIWGLSNVINYSKSFEAGVVSLTEKFIKNNPPLKNELDQLNLEIIKIFSELKSRLPEDATVIAVAGTPTSLSCIKQGLLKYDEEKVEGSILYKDELGIFTKQLSELKNEDILNKYQEIVTGREDIILTGTAILFNLAEILRTDKIIVSGRGIRYGSVIDYLSRL